MTNEFELSDEQLAAVTGGSSSRANFNQFAANFGLQTNTVNSNTNVFAIGGGKFNHRGTSTGFRQQCRKHLRWRQLQFYWLKSKGWKAGFSLAFWLPYRHINLHVHLLRQQT